MKGHFSYLTLAARMRQLTGQEKQIPMGADLLLSILLPQGLGSKGKQLLPEGKELLSHPGIRFPEPYRFQDLQKCVCVRVQEDKEGGLCVSVCVLK